jgi:hypothetical protein
MPRVEQKDLTADRGPALARRSSISYVDTIKRAEAVAAAAAAPPVTPNDAGSSAPLPSISEETASLASAGNEAEVLPPVGSVTPQDVSALTPYAF